MAQENWLASLARVHEIPGRARWRYRCRPGASCTAKDIALAAGSLSGVTKARVNAAAHALIVEFDERRRARGVPPRARRAAALL
jgi:hypothetical protein